MDFAELDHFLRRYDEIEKRQVIDHVNINDIALEASSGTFIMPQDPFFKKDEIFIRKHHRFAAMPEHQHAFIELNYLYSGESTQIVNGKEITFPQGTFVLFDKGTRHSICDMGEDDILINIIFRSETIQTTFFKTLENSRSIVSDFLLSAALQSTTRNHFIPFYGAKNKRLQEITRMMLCEFYDPSDYSAELIKHYLSIILMELARVFHQNTKYQKNKSNQFFAVLEYIEDHYQTVTLQELAQKFGFNKNYLGNKLKSETGKTFLELVKRKRLHHACYLMKYTDRQISAIAEEVGYSSPSFFFEQFQKEYQMTPGNWRKINE
ncbi:AraC family transcriptional regulator [Listeria costaricensis]|uniref:AraC family transcriptional regulator n=1 Tax=Listeria costaricensis TaxID=2026604 RepID=UPI000C08D75A|nr:helix-turn-helix domain-containing protein [Listeria costaricensis]